MRRGLIVTADDFGRALPINEAVEDAHRNGILTAASLMVTGDAAADAVERARRLPSLAVGLHVALLDARPALPPSEIPALVEADGRFGRRPLTLGVKLFLDSEARRQALAEMRAQFELFRATGLPLDHVDCHHHYHLHPTVFDLLLPLACAYDAAGMRVPFEPPLPAWRAGGGGLMRRLAGLAHWRRAWRMRRRIRAAGLMVNDNIFGTHDSGGVDRALLGSLLEHLPPGLSEVYAHPATGGWEPFPLPAHYRAADEHRALADPSLAERACRLNLRLTTFSRELARRARRGW